MSDVLIRVKITSVQKQEIHTMLSNIDYEQVSFSAHTTVELKKKRAGTATAQQLKKISWGIIFLQSTQT